MFDAQTLYVHDDTATAVFSPWMPRGADYGIFIVDVDNFSASSADFVLTVDIVHKNSEDAGNGTTAGTITVASNNWASDTTNFLTTVTTGLKELVRYKFTLEHSTGSGTNFAIFKMRQPQWFDALTA
jgi:hypothetical protein